MRLGSKMYGGFSWVTAELLQWKDLRALSDKPEGGTL